MNKHPTFTQVLPAGLLTFLLAAGLTMTMLATFSQLNQQAQQIKEHFTAQTERLLTHQKNLNQQIQAALQGLISVHQNSYQPNRYNQILFGESQLKQVPQVSILGIAPKITEAQLPRFVGHMRDSGFEGFRVRCTLFMEPDCSLPLGDHFPTQLVIPFTPQNAQHLGDDLSTLNGFDRALHLAQAGQKAAGILIVPPQEASHLPPAGELVIQPFFAPVLESFTPRPDLYRTQGVVFAWIPWQRLLESMIGRTRKQTALQIQLTPTEMPQHSWRAQTPSFEQATAVDSIIADLLNIWFPVERHADILIHQIPWMLDFKRSLTLQDFKTAPLVTTAVISLLVYLLILSLLYQVRYKGVLLRNENEQIRRLAYYDPLTSLPNKRHFIHQLRSQISEHSAQMHVMILELYHFKKIHQARGHETGDRILKRLAESLQQTLSTYESVSLARLEGAEFALCIVDHNRSQVDKIAKHLIKIVEQHPVFTDCNLHFSANAGISHHPEDGAHPDLLIRRATAALSHAQKRGPGHLTHFYVDLENSLLQQAAIESHLHTALQNGEFSLAYQPQYNLKTGRIDAVEALLRWYNPQLGFVTPDQFIPILEQNLGINAVGDWVIKTSIRQLCDWRRRGIPIERIAINISAVQLVQPRFIEKVQRWVRLANLPRHAIELELTERTVMSDVEENLELFSHLASAGYSLSVDDFGTGFSSLSYLKAFPLNILKIDKSFVDGLPHKAHDVALTEAIIQLAHNLNMQVIAEGVETREQVVYLAEAGCEKIQGYWLSHPLPRDTLETWLTQFEQRYRHFADALPASNQLG